MPPVSLVAALARNGVIGRAGAIPWHLPEDLKHFRRLTLGRPVIMGRKTFESILASLGRALPGRENIVVSRSRGYAAPGARVVHSLDEALHASEAAQEAAVIGGAEIYALGLPLASTLHLTEIHADFEGDTYFPAFEPGAWQECVREPHAGPQGLRYDFVTYRRAIPAGGAGAV